MTQKVCNDKTGSDKKLHALVTFAIGAVLAGLLSVFKFPTPALPAAITFVVAIAIGIAKECHDRKQKGNHFCIWDLLADAIGAVAAALLALLANYYTWHDAYGNIIS